MNIGRFGRSDATELGISVDVTSEKSANQTGRIQMTAKRLPERIINLLNGTGRTQAVDDFRERAAIRRDALDQISAVAALVFDAPVAQVTALDGKDQHFLSSQGFDILEAPSERSFCAHAIAEDSGMLVILDTHTDSRFRDNPYVTDEPFIRFYAGSTITHLGIPLGTLCVYDFKPRRALTVEQESFLKDLASRIPGILFRGEPLQLSGNVIDRGSDP